MATHLTNGYTIPNTDDVPNITTWLDRLARDIPFAGGTSMDQIWSALGGSQRIATAVAAEQAAREAVDDTLYSAIQHKKVISIRVTDVVTFGTGIGRHSMYSFDHVLNIGSDYSGWRVLICSAAGTGGGDVQYGRLITYVDLEPPGIQVTNSGDVRVHVRVINITNDDISAGSFDGFDYTFLIADPAMYVT